MGRELVHHQRSSRRHEGLKGYSKLIRVDRDGFSWLLSGSSLFVRRTFPGFSDKHDKKE